MEFLKDMGIFLGKVICFFTVMAFIFWLGQQYLDFTSSIFANWFGVSDHNGTKIGIGSLAIISIIGLAAFSAYEKQRLRK